MAQVQEDYIEDMQDHCQIADKVYKLLNLELFTTEDESGCQHFGAETPYGIIGLTEPDFLRLSSYEVETPTTVSQDPVAQETQPTHSQDAVTEENPPTTVDTSQQPSEQDEKKCSYASMASKSSSQPLCASQTQKEPVSEMPSSTSEGGGASKTQSGCDIMDVHIGESGGVYVCPFNNTEQGRSVASVLGSIIINGRLHFRGTGLTRVLVAWSTKPDGKIFIHLNQVKFIAPRKLNVTLREKEGKLTPFAKIADSEEEVYLPYLSNYFTKREWDEGDSVVLRAYVVKNSNVGKQEWMLHVV